MSEAPQSFPVGSGLSLTRDCRYGDFMIFENDTIIGPSLINYGEWCQGEIDLLSPVAKEATNIVDVGGNIGTHAVAFARTGNPDCSVWSFEPQPEIFHVNCANAVMNGHGRVFPQNKAVGDTSKRLKFPRLDLNQEANFGGWGLRNEEKGHVVEVVTLDDFFGEQHIDLLKIDVQGNEVRALIGAEHLIERCKPVILIENDEQRLSEQIIEITRAAGYQSYWFYYNTFNPDNVKGATTDIWAGGGYSLSLLCIHGDAPWSVTGLRPVSGTDDWWQPVDRENTEGVDISGIIQAVPK